MEPSVRDDARATNDSRKKTPATTGKETPVNSKPKYARTVECSTSVENVHVLVVPRLCRCSPHQVVSHGEDG